MKDTKEALIALALIGKLVLDRTKDGVQLDDAIALGQALLVDSAFKTAVQAGVADYEKIAEEFKDFNLIKGLDLMQVVPELVKILQAPPAV